MKDLSRLLRPRSVAVIGGGAWCKAVVEQLKNMGYRGAIWPVHPHASDLCGVPAFGSLEQLPGAPDAAFVGVNKDATIEIVQKLAILGAGGAVCFASGFGETVEGTRANAELLKAAGEMPILGPNCYGMINALDGACLWPDQHGCLPVEGGVAILTQSSNIAINLTMQRRALPIAYVVTCGNQAQLSEAEVAQALLEDPRVTAIGLHVEGFGDLSKWHQLASMAYDKGVPLVVLKVGRSEQARAATISHTASLAGSDAGAQAFLKHLGVPRVHDLSTFLETLKIMHTGGALASRNIASISCSGGEASLIADLAGETSLNFPALSRAQERGLGQALGPKVALANPLDYHTYIWRDTKAMTRAFSAMASPDLALTCLIVDFPRADRCDPSDWECVIAAALASHEQTGTRLAMVSSLPELMPEDVAKRLMAGGVIPLNGLRTALQAAEAAICMPAPEKELILPTPAGEAVAIREDRAKRALADFGVEIPAGHAGPLGEIAKFADEGEGRFVLKSLGFAHKTDHGGVSLGLASADEVLASGAQMPGEEFLLEEMVQGGIAEILVGIVKDPAHGFVLTVGAGGAFSEILADTASCLLPASIDRINAVLDSLRIAPILKGYRGKPGVNRSSLIDAILALQAYVLANLASVEEVEVNPLICTVERAVAVDALIRMVDE